MRILVPFVAMATLAACQPPVPDSGAGVGFGDYESYQRSQAAREAQLAGGNALPAPQAVSSEPLTPTTAATTAPAPATDTAAADVAADTRAALGAPATTTDGFVNASPSNPAPQTVSNPSGISNENDFAAVGEVRSIESDAAKLAQNRAQYEVVAPTALPGRSGDDSPNIVAYALQSTHPVGTQIHRRVGLNAAAKFERNCAAYPSPDLAQAEFLAKGGPKKDRLGLDPDGDGYACGWDPAPFRKAVGG